MKRDPLLNEKSKILNTIHIGNVIEVTYVWHQSIGNMFLSKELAIY